MERWQQCFKELLNPETEIINRIKLHEGPINNLELEEPSYEEINKIIKNMKPNKAAGPDKILPKFIKNGGLTLKQKIDQLIVKIWKQKKNRVNGQKESCVQYTKMGIENNALVTKGYPY